MAFAGWVVKPGKRDEMYIVKKTNLRIQNAYQNVIVGRPDATEVVGRSDSLVVAIEMAIRANGEKEDYETHCRIEDDAGEIVIGANEMRLAATAIERYVEPHWNELHGTPTVHERAGDDLTPTKLRERMDDHYYGNVSQAAAALGRKGGAATSEAKAAASRENGRRGGRPRKQTEE